MINIGNILKRSWQILWSYRILWIFGILLALTAGGLNNNMNFRNQAAPSTTNPNQGALPPDMGEWTGSFNQWFMQNVQPLVARPWEHVGTFVTIAVIILLVFLVLGALAALVRYPSETAVIRMVDEYENSGSKLSFRQGWRLGWSRQAFHLWLIDLVLAVPVLALVLLIGVAGWIAFSSVTFAAGFQVAQPGGLAAAVALAIISVFLLVVWGLAISLLRNFFARVAVLENKGVQAALREGWAMFRRNWKSAGLMWLVMIGIAIGLGILGLVVFILLVPTYLVMLVPAVITAILPALIAFGVSSLFTSAPFTWIIAVLAAVPFFFIVLFLPFILFNGWYKIYSANSWTLTYREIKTLENLAPPASLPVTGAPDQPAS